MISVPPGRHTRFSSASAFSGLSSRWITLPATTLSKDSSGYPSAVISANAKVTFRKAAQFFLDAGYRDVRITLAEGRIPCAVAVMKKKEGD